MKFHRMEKRVLNVVRQLNIEMVVKVAQNVFIANVAKKINFYVDSEMWNKPDKSGGRHGIS